MSSISYRELSLSEVIEEANLIVEVKFLKAYREEIEIAHRDVQAPAEKFPPFIKKGNVYSIVRVLKNTDKIKIPETINVPSENWHRSLSQHKEKHLQAPSKSYTVPEYISSISTVTKASVLFLNHFQNRYEFAAKNAWEDEAALEKIEMLILA